MRPSLFHKDSPFLLAAAVALSCGLSQVHASLIFNKSTGGGSIGGFDDASGSLTLPFTFNYYGTGYTSATGTSNGVIGFYGISSGAYDSSTWYNTGAGKPVIATLWDDLSYGPNNILSGTASGATGGTAKIGATTYTGIYTLTAENVFSYGNTHNFSTGISIQTVLVGTGQTVTLANGHTFTFQAGDIAMAYTLTGDANQLSAFSGGNAAIGLSNGTAASVVGAPIAGVTNGVVPDSKISSLPTGESFFLYRDNGAGGYTASVATFAAPVAFADVTVTPSSGARTATAESNTIDITATAGSYDITGTTLTGAGFSVSNIANATGTTGNKNGVVSFASAGKLNGDYAGTYGFSIANANSGNGAYSYTLSTTVSGNTGNQSATIAAGTDLGNLTNKLSGTSDKSLASVATLLDGTLSGDSTIAMSWRDRAANEIYPGTGGPFLTTPAGLYSDVLDLSGIAPGDIFVLQMSYSEAAFTAAGLDEAGASLGFLDGIWKNAIAGNTAGPLNLSKEFGAFVDLGTPGLADDLGRWGVDTSTNTVWAVINHNSEFAVIPEPASLGLLSIGALALLARRRK